MGRKKPAEEHENLERYLVSYADFMTLMFATFVVLYALAQSDVNAFKAIEESLKTAFTQSLFQEKQDIMSGEESIFDGASGGGSPLMLEYMSQKYEQTSYEEIQQEVEGLQVSGLSANIDERGLVIKLDSQVIRFKPGSAELPKESYEVIGKIAEIIKKRFSIHIIEVDGHTDSDGIVSPIYPSNWELSSARSSAVIRHLISHHDFSPKIFIASGLADTIPVIENNSKENKAKNRRVELIILRNKNKHLVKKNTQEILKDAQRKLKERRFKDTMQPSEAIQGLIGSDSDMLKSVIDMRDLYKNEQERLKNFSETEYVLDGRKPDFLK